MNMKISFLKLLQKLGLLPPASVMYICGSDTLPPPLTSEEELLERIQDADIVLCNKTYLGKREMDAAKNLKYIGIFATGFNNIDTAYAREKGITVILITHHMDEAAMAQRVVVLHKGKVAADGSPKAVFSQVELLHNIGLAAPDTVELCYELNKLGFSLPLDRLNAEECAQALYNYLEA